MKDFIPSLSRREFIQKAGMSALGMELSSLAMREQVDAASSKKAAMSFQERSSELIGQPNMIGAYGPWADSIEEGLPSLSFRHRRWTSIEEWRPAAQERFLARLAQPDTGEIPELEVQDEYSYDGLHVEELSWELPYGYPTKATLLKPKGAEGPLPGILGLHDHGGNKYFGRRKITKTSDEQHPIMTKHQEKAYGGRAWANEVARRGYVVLVPDAFAFASRRVRLENVPEEIRDGLPAGFERPEKPENISAYNRWAADHESIMAKSLFCAGTTWPGVFLGEDQRALDVLSSRDDVDDERVGCAGLSGGGLRTVMLSGVDPRIQCAVCVGMMTTWRDYLLHKSHTHTWMIYVPLLPRELNYPEILGLRVPKPTLVLNNEDDPLFTISEQERADVILQEVYEKAEAGDLYRCSFYPGPHKFDKEMQKEAFDWFGQWL